MDASQCGTVGQQVLFIFQTRSESLRKTTSKYHVKTQADNKRKVLSKRGKTETKVETAEEQEAGDMEKEEELTRKLTGNYLTSS